MLFVDLFYDLWIAQPTQKSKFLKLKKDENPKIVFI